MHMYHAPSPCSTTPFQEAMLSLTSSHYPYSAVHSAQGAGLFLQYCTTPEARLFNTHSRYVFLGKLVGSVRDKKAGLTDRTVTYNHALDGLHIDYGEREGEGEKQSLVSSVGRLLNAIVFSPNKMAELFLLSPHRSHEHGLQIGEMAHPKLILASIFTTDYL